MFRSRIRSIAAMAAILVATAAGFATDTARADHACDPVSDVGWSIVPSHETTGQTDGAPYRTVRAAIGSSIAPPPCFPCANYFNETGIYSMRSYSLSPRITKERVGICRGTAGGGSVAGAALRRPLPAVVSGSRPAGAIRSRTPAAPSPAPARCAAAACGPRSRPPAWCGSHP